MSTRHPWSAGLRLRAALVPVFLLVDVSFAAPADSSNPAARADTGALGAPTPVAGSATTEVPTAGPAAPRTVEHEGQVFELASSSSTANIETDEYVAAGEKLAGWTQLVTVQRITSSRPTAADEFVAYFRQRIEAESGASFDLLAQAKGASVFAVRFPKSDANDEQVMICLAFPDRDQPTRLNILQYAIKPTRVPVDAVAARIKSWRDKFLRSADALAGAGGTHGP